MTFVVGKDCINCKHTTCVQVCEPECPVDAIFAEDEVPADQLDFIEINEKYSKIWPNITEAKDPMPDYKDWEKREDKISYLELD